MRFEDIHFSPERLGAARKKDGVEKYEPFLKETVIEWGDGKRLDFLGVAHIPETLEAYRNEIIGKIKESDAVFLEDAPLATNLLTEQSFEIMRGIAKKYDISYEADRILEAFYNLPSVQFMLDVEKIVAESEKEMVLADPNVRNLTGGALEKGNDDAKALKVHLLHIAAMASMVSASGVAMGALGLIDDLNAQQKMSRRTFLKLSGCGALTALSMLIGKDIKSSIEIGSDITKNRTKDGPMVFSSRDYRDVVIAEAMDQLALPGKKVAAVYGADHCAPIAHYLRFPEERRLKLAAYENYRKIAPPIADVYEYDVNNRWWDKKRSIDL